LRIDESLRLDRIRRATPHDFTIRELFSRLLVAETGVRGKADGRSLLNPQVGVALALIVGIILGSASLNPPRWNSIAQLFRSDTSTALPRDGLP
jgi:hypothetical protein